MLNDCGELNTEPQNTVCLQNANFVFFWHSTITMAVHPHVGGERVSLVWLFRICNGSSPCGRKTGIPTTIEVSVRRCIPRAGGEYEFESGAMSKV